MMISNGEVCCSKIKEIVKIQETLLSNKCKTIRDHGISNNANTPNNAQWRTKGDRGH